MPQIDPVTITPTKFTKSLKDMSRVELAKLLFDIIVAKTTAPTPVDGSIIPLTGINTLCHSHQSTGSDSSFFYVHGGNCFVGAP
jgi:hypothetical protein